MSEEPSIESLATLYKHAVPLAVGRATIAWNTVCGSVFELFHELSDMEEGVAKEIFFAVASDRSQRDMVSALIKERLSSQHKPLARQANSLLGDVNGLAGKRNHILHVVFVDSNKPQTVHQLHERGALRGKVGHDLIDTIHDFTIKCLDAALGLVQVRGQIRSLPEFQPKHLSQALQRYTSQKSAEEWANQEEYGLLDTLAKTPPSDDGAPE